MIKEIISDFFLFSREWPITIGITGIMQGDNIDAIPARNENIGPMSILSPIEFNYLINSNIINV
ncbi:MAG: hypothetical protein Kow0019_00090 [Methanobacteriaceae archaeon]